jgi:hypothetical protein
MGVASELATCLNDELQDTWGSVSTGGASSSSSSSSSIGDGDSSSVHRSSSAVQKLLQSPLLLRLLAASQAMHAQVLQDYERHTWHPTRQ